MNQERLIPESELREAVRAVLAEMLGVGNAPIGGKRQWYDTKDAYELLGLDSPEQLREAVRGGLLRVGCEVRDRRKPNASKPRYQFNIPKCQKRLAERPEKRWHT
ncbi:hypothetical protein [Halomicronema sp. CCY15110]|uniref:hypothetical protein n=1 Tax=Halomicronema sp. CCY15110 TaxID=2767773 RepID=UPI0019516BB0|nr:hypothetical protein [Halomicronema sp. CCY15110]